MTDPAPVAARQHVVAHTDTTPTIPGARVLEVGVHAVVGVAVAILATALIVGGAL